MNKIVKLTKSLLAVAALTFSANAFAAGYVEIFNHTEQRICFGKGTYFYVEGESNGKLIEGWNCVDPDGSYRFDIGLNEYIFVAAIDEENNDFLENRLQNYSPTTTYAPNDLVEFFGVATEERFDGWFLYSFYLNDDDWSNDMLVGSRETLDYFLGEAGFRKITGRLFRGADYPNGLAVAINF